MLKRLIKGQVIIRVEILERFGRQPITEVEFQVQGAMVRPVKSTRKRARQRGTEFIKQLAGKANVKMTTDQILALTRDYR